MTLALNIIIRIQMCKVISMHKSLCIKFLQSKNSILFGINYPLALHKGVKGAEKMSKSRSWRDFKSRGCPTRWESNSRQVLWSSSLVGPFLRTWTENESGRWASGYKVWLDESRPPLTHAPSLRISSLLSSDRRCRLSDKQCTRAQPTNWLNKTRSHFTHHSLMDFHVCES